MFGREPTVEEANVPSSVGPALARSLSDVAGSFIAARLSLVPAESVAQCPELAGGDFSRSYWAYFRDIRFARDEMPPLAYVRAWRVERRWRKLVESRDASNPLFFDASTDASYWVQ
jgi:hypothetical protein